MHLPSSTWERLTRSPFYLDRSDTQLTFDHQQIQQFYFPLSLHLLESAKADRRLLVCVAGIPGSGKTSFSSLLSALINAHTQQELALLVSQDGWHYPNTYLDSHTIQRNDQVVPLRSLKGAPESYDTAAIFAFLSAIHHGDSPSFPLYDRRLHDPVPDTGQLLKSHRILIFEGNYWLLDEDPWRSFYPFFDLHIFLSADANSLLDALRQRHLAGGKSPQFIEEHLHRVDLPNATRILKNRLPADILVHKQDSFRISSIA